jgi:hypothetical protein
MLFFVGRVKNGEYPFNFVSHVWGSPQKHHHITTHHHSALSEMVSGGTGITGWQPGDAKKACIVCFRAWIKERGGIEATDTKNAIDHEGGRQRAESIVQTSGGWRLLTRG